MSSVKLNTRLLFWLCVAFAAASVWFITYPPMTDLPQNAGHAALLLDYWRGTSPWADIIYANYFTPYLTGYFLAAFLALFMPVLAAMKLMLSAAFLAYIDICIRLRKHYKVDARLDWLLIPGFFGHAWHWGFFTFLISAPICLWFILLSAKYAEAPTMRKGVILSLFGTLLFFTHGFVFGFAVAIGGLMLLSSQKIKHWIICSLPWVPLFILAALYVYSNADMVMSRNSDIAYGHLWIRLLQLPSFIVSGIGSSALLLIGLVLLFVPFVIAKPNRTNSLASFVPILFFALCWFALPYRFSDLIMLYQRLAIFAMPLLILVFANSDNPAKNTKSYAHAVLILSCLSWLGLHTAYIVKLNHHEQDFMTVMAAAEPAKRAIILTYDTGNDTPENYELYYHTPQWYQVEKQGLVDFSFLTSTAAILHYKPGNTSILDTYQSVETIKYFDWAKYEMAHYQYIFVRHTKPLPEDTFENNQCDVNLIRQSGAWSLYGIGNCK